MLTAAQVTAANLTALGRSARQCAEQLKVCRKTVERWRQAPEFRDAVAQEIAALRKQIREHGAAVKEARILAKRRRLQKLLHIASHRAGNPKVGGASWDESGFMVRREVCIGGGKFGRFKVEYELDKSLLDAINDLERDIAIEMGEWKQSIDVTGVEAVSTEIVELASVFTPLQIDEAIQRFRELQEAHEPSPGAVAD
jgi:hypothetical protein